MPLTLADLTFPGSWNIWNRTKSRQATNFFWGAWVGQNLRDWSTNSKLLGSWIVDWVAPVQNDTSVGLLCHHREIDGNSARDKHPDLNCVGRGRKPASNGIWAPSAALCLLGIHCVPVNRCASGERQLAYSQFSYIVYYRLLFTDFVVFQNECFQRWIPRKNLFQWFSCFTLLYDLIFKSGTCDCSFYSLQPLFSKQSPWKTHKVSTMPGKLWMSVNEGVWKHVESAWKCSIGFYGQDACPQSMSRQNTKSCLGLPPSHTDSIHRRKHCLGYEEDDRKQIL